MNLGKEEMGGGGKEFYQTFGKFIAV